MRTENTASLTAAFPRSPRTRPPLLEKPVTTTSATNPGPDRIEEAPTARSLCRTCKKAIAKGEMRFSEEFEDLRGDSARRFHHLTCAASSKLAPRVRVVLNATAAAIPDRAKVEALLAARPNRPARTATRGG